MQAIIDGITAICDFFSALIGFVLDTITNMINMIIMVGEAAATIPKLFGILPPVLTSTLAGILAIAIAYKILGRE